MHGFAMMHALMHGFALCLLAVCYIEANFQTISHICAVRGGINSVKLSPSTCISWR